MTIASYAVWKRMTGPSHARLRILILCAGDVKKNCPATIGRPDPVSSDAQSTPLFVASLSRLRVKGERSSQKQERNTRTHRLAYRTREACSPFRQQSQISFLESLEAA